MVNSRRAHINSNFLRSGYITKKVTFIAKWWRVSGYIHGEMVVASVLTSPLLLAPKNVTTKPMTIMSYFIF